MHSRLYASNISARAYTHIHTPLLRPLQESQGAVSVVTTGEDGKINFIDPYQKQIYMSKQTSSTSLYGACFASHNSNNLFTVGMGGRLQQWDVRQAASSSSNRPSNTYVDTNSRALLSLRPHPSRPHVIATGSVEGLLNIWDVRSNAVPTCSLQAHQSMLWDLLFLPTDPTKLLTCGEDGNLIVWDFNKNNANPTSIRFSSEQRDAIQPTKLYDNTLSLNTLAIDTESNTILCGADSQNILHLKHY